ncbi:hypothetical protein ACIBPB_14725 [Micromonospora sp. NPDC049836]|uniref:hypothetical protein n=1 Tax=Micromonospora sp. NPDC049836 TaxID=3364274 RepID=UPI0037B8B014
MKSGARVALAVGFGYLLGRRKKMRTALTLAAAVAAGRASQQPGGLKKVATDLIGANPQLGNLSKLGVPLATAGRAAASAAAGNGIDVLSGKLRDGADALRRRSSGGTGTQPASDERSAPDEEPDLEDQPAARDDGGRDDGGRDDGGRDDGGRREAPVARRAQRGR